MEDQNFSIRQDYLEELNHNGEISFIYRNKRYNIEPSGNPTDPDYRFQVWEFEIKKNAKGKIVAECKTPDNVLDNKIFDGKSLMEIDGEITDCYLW